MLFLSSGIFNGSPEVVPKTAPMVQIVPGRETPPFGFLSAPEKSSYLCAISVRSGITFWENAPPFSRSMKVTSMDSRYMKMRFLFFPGNTIFTDAGSTYSSRINVVALLYSLI